jgi:hypothetical protein
MKILGFIYTVLCGLGILFALSLPIPALSRWICDINRVQAIPSSAVFSREATVEELLQMSAWTAHFPKFGRGGALNKEGAHEMRKMTARLADPGQGIIWCYGLVPQTARREGSLLTIEGEKRDDGRIYWAAVPEKMTRGISGLIVAGGKER